MNNNILVYLVYLPIGLVVECSPMGRDTGVQSQVEPYQNSKMVLDASLLNTQRYKACFNGKVEQSREMNSTLPYISVL